MSKPATPKPSRQGVRRWLAGTALISAAVGIALITSGCGTGSVLDPVAKAATVSNGARGARMSFLMEVTSPRLGAPVTAVGSASVDMADRSGSASFVFKLPRSATGIQQPAGRTLHMDLIIERSAAYLRAPAAFRSKIPGNRPWVKLDIAHSLNGLPMSGMSGDPSQLLQYLRAVSGTVTKLGSASIAGFQTTHYHATISLQKLADDAPTNNRAALKSSLQQFEALAHITQLPVDVWIDGNHLVRRLAMHMNMELLGGVPITFAMQVTIPQYGPQPPAKAPPASQVTTMPAPSGVPGQSLNFT